MKFFSIKKNFEISVRPSGSPSHAWTMRLCHHPGAEPCVLLHGSSFMKAAECGPGRQLWTGMRVSVTAYLLQGPSITENKFQRTEAQNYALYQGHGHGHGHGVFILATSSMRSIRGGFIFRNRGPSLKVHHGQCLTSMTIIKPPHIDCIEYDQA